MHPNLVPKSFHASWNRFFSPRLFPTPQRSGKSPGAVLSCPVRGTDCGAFRQYPHPRFPGGALVQNTHFMLTPSLERCHAVIHGYPRHTRKYTLAVVPCESASAHYLSKTDNRCASVQGFRVEQWARSCVLHLTAGIRHFGSPMETSAEITVHRRVMDASIGPGQCS